MEAASTAIYDHLAVLADPVRGRMLLVLEGHELIVAELCSVLQLPQSTVSRHLKTLADTGWVASRRDGTSRVYSLAPADDGAGTHGLWDVVRAQIGGTSGAADDRRRLDGVLARRRSKSQEFFASAAGRWDRVREELFGRRFHLRALAGLLDDRWVVGDLGCGTGMMAEAVAPFVSGVVAVDGSPEMLEAAGGRLRGVSNVELRPGALEALPIADGTLDAAMLMLVLHHVPDPVRVLAEAARVLRPGGRLLIADMMPHDHQEYRQQMGHVWLGFSEGQIARYVAAAGFELPRLHALPAEDDAKGPTLFAATARKRGHAPFPAEQVEEGLGPFPDDKEIQ
jgi:ubiquinone/menaquinone biosynthesis C-methylase UbiE